MKLYSESTILKRLESLSISNPAIFFDGMKPEPEQEQVETQIDDKSNQLLLQTSATILAGIIAKDGVSENGESRKIDVMNSLRYTNLLIQQIDQNA